MGGVHQTSARGVGDAEPCGDASARCLDDRGHPDTADSRPFPRCTSRATTPARGRQRASPSGRWDAVGRGIYLAERRGGRTEPHRRPRRGSSGVHAAARSRALVQPRVGRAALGSAAVDPPRRDPPLPAHRRQQRAATASVSRHPVRAAGRQRTSSAACPSTSLERTVVDCATTLPPLRRARRRRRSAPRRADRPEVIERVLASRPGAAASPAHERSSRSPTTAPSPPASRPPLRRSCATASRCRRHRSPVATRLGTFWADLGWEEWRLLLEYDGRVASTTDARPTSSCGRSAGTTPSSRPAGESLRVTKEDLRGTTRSRAASCRCSRAARDRARPRRALAAERHTRRARRTRVFATRSSTAELPLRPTSLPIDVGATDERAGEPGGAAARAAGAGASAQEQEDQEGHVQGDHQRRPPGAGWRGARGRCGGGP